MGEMSVQEKVYGDLHVEKQSPPNKENKLICL